MKKDEISYDDFSKLDLRIGKVVDGSEVEGSDKLLKLTVDMGSEYGMRTIFAGLKLGGYTPSDIIGKQFTFVANLAPRKIMESKSEGMMLAADCEGKPVLIEINAKVAPGSIVM